MVNVFSGELGCQESPRSEYTGCQADRDKALGVGAGEAKSIDKLSPSMQCPGMHSLPLLSFGPSTILEKGTYLPWRKGMLATCGFAFFQTCSRFKPPVPTLSPTARTWLLSPATGAEASEFQSRFYFQLSQGKYICE